jgi:hypothetical protein
MAFEGPFLQQPESAIASFDWQDIATGLGYQDLYGADVITGSTYALLPREVYSNSVEVTAAASSSSSFNMDTSIFNTPRFVQGDMIFTSGINNGASGTSNVQIRLVKVASVTAIETAITASTNLVHAAAASQSLLTMATCTETAIGVGDKLRLKVYINCPSAGTSRVSLGIDPMNRNTGYIGSPIPTKMVVSIPFKIER